MNPWRQGRALSCQGYCSDLRLPLGGFPSTPGLFTSIPKPCFRGVSEGKRRCSGGSRSEASCFSFAPHGAAPHGGSAALGLPHRGQGEGSGAGPAGPGAGSTAGAGGAAGAPPAAVPRGSPAALPAPRRLPLSSAGRRCKMAAAAERGAELPAEPPPLPPLPRGARPPPPSPEEVARRLASTRRELSNRRKILLRNLPAESSSQVRPGEGGCCGGSCSPGGGGREGGSGLPHRGSVATEGEPRLLLPGFVSAGGGPALHPL